jgi:hypothetical protein
MTGNPRVFELLDETLDLAKTSEEVCRECPELLLLLPPHSGPDWTGAG